MSLEPPKLQKLVRAGIYGTGIIVLGFTLFRYTTPTEEQLISRFSPEIRAEYEQNKLLRQQEQQELMKIVQQTSKSNDPIWKTGKISSPFEKDTRGMNPNLVDQKKFERQQALAHQQHQVEQSQLQLQETEKLLTKKPWYKFW